MHHNIEDTREAVMSALINLKYNRLKWKLNRLFLQVILSNVNSNFSYYLRFIPISMFHKKELITSSHTDIFTKTQTLRGLTRIQSQKYEISMIKWDKHSIQTNTLQIQVPTKANLIHEFSTTAKKLPNIIKKIKKFSFLTLNGMNCNDRYPKR